MTFKKQEIEFATLPAGRFSMGLNDDEKWEAHELTDEPRIWWESVTPARDVDVEVWSVSIASAACLAESVAIGTPAPGCAPPPHR